MNLRDYTTSLCVIALAIGVAAAGFFIGQGFAHSRSAERYVTVKGLVERDVTADLAVWNINFSALGDDLIQVNNNILQSKKIVTDFLKQKGFKEDEITVQNTKVTDMFAAEYQSHKPEHRYRIDNGITVRSNQVNRIQQVSQQSGELVQQGVALTVTPGESDAVNPIYFYTQLPSLRPSMLAEAAQSARNVAEQFAKNAGNQIGKIRHANQGVFEIVARDSANASNADSWQIARTEKSSIYKKLRLVTTIEYLLEN